MANRRPTILQIIPQLDTGGAELSAIEIADALVRAGARALVATEGGRMAHRITDLGGEIVTLPLASKNPATIYTNAGRLARLIAAEDVDLVHARSRAPAWSALWAARRTTRPFVTTYHGAYGETGPIKRAYNAVMAKGNLTIANSAYTAGLIMGRYGTPLEKLRIIHRGVDELAFDPTTIAADRIAALRAQWRLPAAPTTVILQAARLTRWKGQNVLVDALTRLAERRPELPWVAILAGDDQGRADYRTELTSTIAARGLADRIRLVGHVDDMPAAFAIASVTVIASVEPEAFGRTSIEAQRMGCPVIATRIGAPPETVLAPPAVTAEARTGWLVPPADAAALSDALAEALALSPAERVALAARATRHAGTHFTLDAMRRSTLAVYDELLGTDLVARFDAAHGRI
jgi:glycosyltransferase involved in cell wall biosynthesis